MTRTGWSLEESLDVETVHSVCQKCKIILIETNEQLVRQPRDGRERGGDAQGDRDLATRSVVPETGATATDEAAYNHPGIVTTASAGDDGYFSFDHLAGVNAPEEPASFNTVVAVGGTSLYLDQTGKRQSETVWNDNGPRDIFEQDFGQSGAGGGGCSSLITAQPWQHAVPNWSQTVCGTHRLSTDVSADADYLTGFDVYDSFDVRQRLRPVAGLLHDRRNIAGLADHRLDVGPGRRCARRQVSVAEPLRPPRYRVAV